MNNTSAPNTTIWLRLAEYGDWPHPRGLQRFTPSAANVMVQYFKSLRGRLARKFGGLPVYIGHPDDAQFSGTSGHTDTRAYAWVTDLEARRDGLYGSFKWSAAGDDLLSNAFYKFLSPRWAMEPIGTDTFQPVRLLSVGLTNQPNIPGEAIANSAEKNTNEANAEATTTNACMVFDGKTASMERVEPNDAAGTVAEAGVMDEQQISRSQLCDALGIGSEIDPLEAIGELRDQSERFYRIACEQSDKLSHESASLANARSEQLGLIVQNALLSGRIAPHEIPAWQKSFETDWDGAQAALSKCAHSLKTTAIANTRQSASACANSTDDFLARVEAHAKANNQNFAEAWCDLKRRHPEVYQQFFAAGN